VVVAGGAGDLGVVVGVGEQVGHGGGPDLPGGVGGVEGAQVSQQVRAAPGVMRVDEVGVAGIAEPVTIPV
jgi:hypothetical protein